MIKVIACKIFETYIKQLSLDFSNYDIEYLPIQSHNHPHQLSKSIQTIIDNSQSYDKILLLYGVCGMMIFDLEFKKTPTYVIGCHDCASIMLGGYSNFLKCFQGDLSRPWTCISLLDNKEEYHDNYYDWVEKYGQEEAEYLREVLHVECTTYISMGEKTTDYPNIMEGNMEYLEKILLLEQEDLLLLQENQKLILTNNNDVIKIKEETN